LYLAAEDGKKQLQRMLHQIARSLRLQAADCKNLRLVDLTNENAELCFVKIDREKGEQLTFTEMLKRVEALVAAERPGVTILDSSVDFYGGNENHRQQVKTFIRRLRNIAERYQTGIVLLAHPSVEGMKTARGYSGSTSWHNAVRSRLYFCHAPEGEPVAGQPPKPDNRRILSRAKGNRASSPYTEVEVWWFNGAFGAFRSGEAGATEQIDALVDAEFLRLLAEMHDRNVRVSYNQRSNNYAPKEFAARTKTKFTKRQFKASMERLMDAGKIKNASYGSPSHPHRELRLAT
jgi:RecA-family ATPase